MHGGATAEFLRADEEEGQALIEQLMREEPSGRSVDALLAEADAPREAPPLERDDEQGVIDALMTEEEPVASSDDAAGDEPAPEDRPESGPDRSLIDSLLDDETERER